MVDIFIGFCFGFLIPFIARRLGKILPSTTGAIFFNLVHFPKVPHTHNPLKYRDYCRKWQKLFMNALLFGLLTAGFFWMANIYIPTSLFPYATIFIWIVLCAANVDMRFFILPDCLTIPLMLIGFLFATQTQAISPEQSVYGGFFAYAITTISVFLLNFTKNNLFGAGDSKMLIALGLWLGIQGLNYAVFISFLLFVLYSFVIGKRFGAYGPALGLAGLFSFFILYAK